MSDKNLCCKDCNVEFVFTESEQAFYKEKGFENEPQRCFSCRQKRKQSRKTSGFHSGGNRFANKMGSRSFNSLW